MLQKFRNQLIVLAAVTVAVLLLALPTVVLAQVPTNPDVQNQLCTGADQLQIGETNVNCQNLEGDESGFNDLLAQIINIISVIVGVVAVIMIIYGGFRYITSGGTAEKVTAAKNTILYGIIGLIIVALAQVIVRFVLKQVTE
jgi:hypothetical protein